MENRAVRQHGFQSLHQATHGSEAQHLGAARIRRNQSADRRGAFGAERQGESPIDRGGGSVQIFEDHASFADCAVAVRRKRANPVHAPQGQQQRIACRAWRCAADHSGITALRDDGDARLCAERHDRGDFLCACRRRHRCSCAMIAAPPIHQPGLHFVRIAREAPWPQAIGKLLKKLLHWPLHAMFD